MSNQKRLLLSLPVAEGDCTHVDVEVFYNKGGMNYFTAQSERRGYYLSAQPLTKSENSRGYTAFSGVKQFIKEAGRYSPKVLNELVISSDEIKSMVNHVIQKNNIKLVSEDSLNEVN